MPNYNLIQYQKQAMLERMDKDTCTCPPPDGYDPGCPVCGLRGAGPWYDEAHMTYERKRIFIDVDGELSEQVDALMRAIITVDNDSIPF